MTATPDPEFRLDPLTGRWVAITAHRQKRPNLPADDCPFCVGGLEAPERYEVKWIPNRWPPLTPGPPLDFSARDPGSPQIRPGRGAAEVVLYSPDHDASLATIGLDGVRRVVDLWAERTAALLGRPEIDAVLIFENRGGDVGATIPHPHGQIYAFPFQPPVLAREAERAARYGCPLCSGEPNADLVVTRTAGWTASVPFASEWPYALLLAPSAHVAGLPDLDDSARDDLSSVLVDALSRFDRLHDGRCPYMLWIHQGLHVHIHLVTPLRGPNMMRYLAAGELGSGVLANPVRPEDAAATLRAL